MTAVPILAGVEAPAGAIIVLTPRRDDLHPGQHPRRCDQPEARHPGIRPSGNGITRAYSKAAAFDDPYTPVITAIDIKAKCGAPSAGSPKVFFKYSYVNTASRELFYF